jgi:hypothetical protein
VNQLQRISRRRNQPILNSACRPDEQNLGLITLLELVGYGERGDHMSARASARQNGSHAVTINDLFSIIYVTIDLS